jgi:para-nitrobenzyl esterase
MLTAWTNFAKYSDPNGEPTANSQSPTTINWEPCTNEKPQFMRFKLDDNDAEASDMGEFMVDGEK